MINNNLFVEAAYNAYSEQAGGKTFDGKTLPTFEELGEERQTCWKAAAKAVELMTLGATINLLTHTYNLVVADEAKTESVNVRH